MPTEYSSIAADLFTESEVRATRLAQLLSEPSDLVSLVLRGHLVIEELLFAACAAYCQDVEQLKQARLRFPQLISLLRALEKISAVPPNYWEALLELNALRNALAHKLEPSDVEAKIRRLIQIANPIASSDLKAEKLSAYEQLNRVLHFLMGGFEVVAVWHEAFETLLAHRALGKEDHSKV